MYKRFLPILVVLFASACSSEKQTAEKQFANKASTASVAQSRVELTAETESKNLETEFLKRLNAERDPDQRRSLGDQYSLKYRELAHKYPDTSVADEAWCTIVALSRDALQQEAMNRQLEMAETNQDSERVVKLLASVVDFGVDPQKSTALERLIRVAMIEPATEISIKGLAALAVSNEIDIETRDIAVKWLLEHHPDHAVMLDVITGMNQVKVNRYAEVERWLKTICERTSGEIQASAVVTLARMIKRREEQKGFYLGKAAPGADYKRQQEAFSRLPLSYIEYLRTPVDSDEQPELEKWLISVVENKALSNLELQNEARQRLFVLQNLIVGKQAPEIVGTDLDGVKFKLTDYRGKVVLLTFWADY